MPLPTPTGAIRSRGLLWCEGPHDFAFLRRMLGYLGISEEHVRVEVFEGKDRLPAYLTTLTLRPGFSDLQSLGIVRDADENAQAAFQSVKAFLTRNGLVTPDASGGLGTGSCFDGRRRTVGVFIAPDGATPGALESLYLRAIGEDPITECVRAFTRCIAPHVRHALVAQVAKVEFHAWLASTPQPGILPGQALDAGYIDRDSPEFEPIKRFLRDLAGAAADGPHSPQA